MLFSIFFIFIIGYLLIILEHKINVNKAAIALITAGFCWAIYIINAPNKHEVTIQLNHHLGNISEILFFLLGAMTIIEVIDAHSGFEFIIRKIQTRSYKKLLYIIAFITFFLSAILDNLTTTIVMVSLIRKIIDDNHKRKLFAGVIIIAANAGGAWSPMGDVTTTMLWIGNQITPILVIKKVFLASLVCLLLPLIIIAKKINGNIPTQNLQAINKTSASTTTVFEQNFALFLGVGILAFVPFFKTITHLPPYIIILLGLGVLWLATELIHTKKTVEDKSTLTVASALQKIDTPSILFFLGILLSVAALESIELLTEFAQVLNHTIKNDSIIAIIIGLISAILDNVPLVAAIQGMYGLDLYPTDHFFWQFLAYTSGTGGSCLIIGSAAGVTAMSMEKIDFFWYLKQFSGLALLGYLAGAAVYLLQNYFFS